LKAFEGFTAGVIDALEQARTALGQEIGLSQFVHALPDVVAYRVRSGHVEIADQTVTSFEEQHPRMQRCPPFLARGDSPRTLAKGSCHLVKGPYCHVQTRVAQANVARFAPSCQPPRGVACSGRR